VSWVPNDLVTDQDLRSYESTILSQFHKTDWEDKRAKALEDWLLPILRTQGFDPDKWRIRYEADAVLADISGAFSDKKSDATDRDTDDVNLAAVFATAGTDALYLGSTRQFRGLSVRMHAGVSAVAALLTVSYWNDAWTPLTIVDGTQKAVGKSFSGGGAVTWRPPSGWVTRKINDSQDYYFVKLTMSATPTAATAGQIGVIRRSVFCAPVALRTLTLIMREAPSGGDGPWREKAEWYDAQASDALQRALQICGGEFETDDPGTDLISPTEAAQTTAEVSRMPYRMERN